MTENANTPSNRLTHLDSQGRANMVDVSEKLRPCVKPRHTPGCVCAPRL